MKPLPRPEAGLPVMFGAPVPAAELLPWSWAEERLRRAPNYWIATTCPDGAPQCRPVWGVWLSDGFWTGRQRLRGGVDGPSTSAAAPR